MPTCSQCHKEWSGPTLGKLYHCTVRSAPKPKTARVKLGKAKSATPRCECGNEATVVDKWSTPICERCSEIETMNQRNFNTSARLVFDTYSVRGIKF